MKKIILLLVVFMMLITTGCTKTPTVDPSPKPDPNPITDPNTNTKKQYVTVEKIENDYGDYYLPVFNADELNKEDAENANSIMKDIENEILMGIEEGKKLNFSPAKLYDLAVTEVTETEDYVSVLVVYAPPFTDITAQYVGITFDLKTLKVLSIDEVFNLLKVDVKNMENTIDSYIRDVVRNEVLNSTIMQAAAVEQIADAVLPTWEEMDELVNRALLPYQMPSKVGNVTRGPAVYIDKDKQIHASALTPCYLANQYRQVMVTVCDNEVDAMLKNPNDEYGMEIQRAKNEYQAYTIVKDLCGLDEEYKKDGQQYEVSFLYYTNLVLEDGSSHICFYFKVMEDHTDNYVTVNTFCVEVYNDNVYEYDTVMDVWKLVK